MDIFSHNFDGLLRISVAPRVFQCFPADHHAHTSQEGHLDFYPGCMRVSLDCLRVSPEFQSLYPKCLRVSIDFLRLSLCRQLEREGQPSPEVREGLEKGLYCMQQAVEILKVKQLCRLSSLLRLLLMCDPCNNNKLRHINHS